MCYSKYMVIYMEKTIIENLPFKIDKIKKTNKGLTNNNYLVAIDDKKYMLRYPLADVKHLFNPENEEKVIKKLKDKDFVLPVKYYKNGIQLTPYFDNLTTFDQANKDTRIKAVAKLMKKFHNLNIKTDFDFDPVKQIYIYKDNIKNIDFDLKPYQKLLDKARNHKFEPVLCHNDWVEGNICFVDNKTYLIDYEYAGNNDPLFDVMSFLTENDLTKQEKTSFLNEMFPQAIDSKTYDKLKMYRDLNNLLWYLWALMMHEFRNDSIYKKIAKIKLNQLTNDYEKDLWI